MKSKFEIWLEEVNEKRKEEWELQFSHKPYEPLTAEKGKKYIKVWNGTSMWAFISMVDGFLKGSPIYKGDLLKPASWKSPAKHSRGNIFKGNDSWSYYGPIYIK